MTKAKQHTNDVDDEEMRNGIWRLLKNRPFTNLFSTS